MNAEQIARWLELEDAFEYESLNLAIRVLRAELKRIECDITNWEFKVRMSSLKSKEAFSTTNEQFLEDSEKYLRFLIADKKEVESEIEKSVSLRDEFDGCKCYYPLVHYLNCTGHAFDCPVHVREAQKNIERSAGKKGSLYGKSLN